MKRRTAWSFAAALLLGAAVPCLGQATGPTSLDELLEKVQAGNEAESRENARREGEFRTQKHQQERLLTEALAARASAEKRSQELEAAFDANEKRIPELEQTLRDRQGTLGELFGVFRQVAGDTRAQIESSIVSAQIPGRAEQLSALTQNREIPSIEQLEKLWFVLQQEMTESGKVVRFPATVVAGTGGERSEEVVRVGTFNVVSGGRFLQYIPETGKLTELGRQPGSRHLRSAEELAAAKTGTVKFSIDPARGSILALLIQTPNRRERVDQGGPIGYVTIALGVFGFLLGVYRMIYLAVVGRRMKAQIGNARPQPDNPLGRVLQVYDQHLGSDVETLELKLDEAILRETPAIERGASMIKVIAVISPLLGLLGTITGMIQAFQVMTLFGSGDPKLMASGIAEALVTTMLGLMVAIPMTLIHSMVTSRSNGLLQILEEQSAGLVAAQAEAKSSHWRGERAAVG